MVDTLPENVDLYENSPLLNWKKINDIINYCNFKNHKIITKKLFLQQMVF
jgi:hypothetical protein